MKRNILRMISIFLLALTILNTGLVGFAAPFDRDGKEDLPKVTVVRPLQDLFDPYPLPEDNYVSPAIRESQLKYRELERLFPNAKAGATEARISGGTAVASYSGLYQYDAIKTAATYALGQSILMTAMSSLLGLNVYISICVDAALSVLGGSIDKNKEVQGKTLISYWYYMKEGQVNTPIGWLGTVFCEKRLVFKHYYGVYRNAENKPKQGTKDYNNYASQAVKTQASSHFNDNNWIKNRALYQFNNGLGYYNEKGW